MCVAAKEAYVMLKYMRELQKGMIPMPGHTEELAKIEQILSWTLIYARDAVK